MKVIIGLVILGVLAVIGCVMVVDVWFRLLAL